VLQWLILLYYLGILPIILDTATNRQGMPDANFDDWTPLSTVAEQLVKWAQGDSRPASGSFVRISTKNKETKFDTL
jgi:dihydropteridine reductase